MPDGDIPQDIVDFVVQTHKGQTGIVYCRTKGSCDEVAATLQAAGVSAAAYYGSMSERAKSAALSGWVGGTVHVVCATIAFGMGVDKHDVRFVVHHDMAKSVEAFLQVGPPPPPPPPPPPRAAAARGSRQQTADSSSCDGEPQHCAV